MAESPGPYPSKVGNVSNPHTNPCAAEGQVSLDCVMRSYNTYENCESQYQNYRNCKQFWGKVRWKRFLARKRPLLPPLEEREEVKKEFAYILEEILGQNKGNT